MDGSAFPNFFSDVPVLAPAGVPAERNLVAPLASVPVHSGLGRPEVAKLSSIFLRRLFHSATLAVLVSSALAAAGLAVVAGQLEYEMAEVVEVVLSFMRPTLPSSLQSKIVLVSAVPPIPAAAPATFVPVTVPSDVAPATLPSNVAPTMVPITFLSALQPLLQYFHLFCRLL